jgi:hypothetical protein
MLAWPTVPSPEPLQSDSRPPEEDLRAVSLLLYPPGQDAFALPHPGEEA